MHLSSYFSQAVLNASDEEKIWRYLKVSKKRHLPKEERTARGVNNYNKMY